MTDPLTVALPKGRVLRAVAPILARAGADVAALLAEDRSLVRESLEAGLRFLLLKPDDVPTYVEYGAADLGVCGRDVLMERTCELYQPLDLGVGRCRMVVAGVAGRALPLGVPRVATKYPRSAAAHLRDEERKPTIDLRTGFGRARADHGPVGSHRRSRRDRNDARAQRSCRDRASCRGLERARGEPGRVQAAVRAGGRACWRAPPGGPGATRLRLLWRPDAGVRLTGRLREPLTPSASEVPTVAACSRGAEGAPRRVSARARSGWRRGARAAEVA